MAACSQRAHTGAEGSQASPSTECTRLQWVLGQSDSSPLLCGEKPQTDEARCFLLACQHLRRVNTCLRGAYHARAGEGVPTEADTLRLLDVAPLVLELFVVGHGVCKLLWEKAGGDDGGGGGGTVNARVKVG